MQPSEKGIAFEKGDVAGIPILSCFISDEAIPSRPLVMLSHAFQSSKEFWQDKMPSLAKAGYYAVALDNRGHGERKGPDFKSQVFEKDGFNLYLRLGKSLRLQDIREEIQRPEQAPGFAALQGPHSRRRQGPHRRDKE